MAWLPGWPTPLGGQPLFRASPSAGGRVLVSVNPSPVAHPPVIPAHSAWGGGHVSQPPPLAEPRLAEWATPPAKQQPLCGLRLGQREVGTCGRVTLNEPHGTHLSLHTHTSVGP